MNTSLTKTSAPGTLNQKPENLSGSPVPIAPARSRRFASMMYEGVLLFGVVFIAGYAFDTLTQSRHALTLRHARQFWLFLIIGLYFIACWGRSGQTLPMKAWHIRLVDSLGNKPTLRQLITRYVMMWLLPLAGAAIVWGIATLSNWPSVLMLIVCAPFCVFIPTWFTPGQQFLHDLITKTRLITSEDSSKIRKNP
jgi:uncharacterized RDD family membrane protein YckC